MPTLLPEALREAALAVVRHHHPLMLPFPETTGGFGLVSRTDTFLRLTNLLAQCDYEIGLVARGFSFGWKGF